jgi:hypothetical protein
MATLLLVGWPLLVAPVSAAPNPKVEVCHFPPGNPDNFHTIRISENALAAHLAHDDLVGSCNALCADICDDGDECTIDDTGDCESAGCPTVRDPVDCNDGLGCTDDSCDSVAGCINTERICVPSDACHVSRCAEPDGVCIETDVVCDPGTACNPDTGLCEPTGGPCFDANDCFGSNDVGCLIDNCRAFANCPDPRSDHISAAFTIGGFQCFRGIDPRGCDAVNQTLIAEECTNICEPGDPVPVGAVCECFDEATGRSDGICIAVPVCDPDFIAAECINFCAAIGFPPETTRTRGFCDDRGC